MIRRRALGFTVSWIRPLPRGDNREVKIWRQQRQLQCHKSMIWLVEWRKIIVLHVRHAFWCNFLTQSAKRWSEIFILEILTITRARSRKCFILYRKTLIKRELCVRLMSVLQPKMFHSLPQNTHQPNAKFSFNVTFSFSLSKLPVLNSLMMKRTMTPRIIKLTMTERRPD